MNDGNRASKFSWIVEDDAVETDLVVNSVATPAQQAGTFKMQRVTNGSIMAFARGRACAQGSVDPPQR